MHLHEHEHMGSSLRIQFGLRVKTLREERGLTQYTLAPLAGVSRTYLADVERGARNVSLETIGKIAEGLGVTLEELMRGM